MKITLDLGDISIDDQSVAEILRAEMQREIRILVRGIIREERKDLRALVERATKEAVESFKKGKLMQIAALIGKDLGA